MTSKAHTMKIVTMKIPIMKIEQLTSINWTPRVKLPLNYACANCTIPSFHLCITNFAVSCHHEKLSL